MRNLVVRGNLLLSTAVALMTVAAATTAAADGPYASVFGGINTVHPMLLHSNDAPYSYDRRILNFNAGGVVGAAIGQPFGPIRGEAEASYRFNGLSKITVQGEGSQAGIGNVHVFAMMANGWFDIPTGMGATPYLGVGAGFANVHLAARSTSGPGDGIDFNQSHTVFAFQLGAGVAVGMQGGAKLSLDYRLFGTGDFVIRNLRGDGYASARASYQAHSLMVGYTMPLGGVAPLRFP